MGTFGKGYYQFRRESGVCVRVVSEVSHETTIISNFTSLFPNLMTGLHGETHLSRSCLTWTKMIVLGLARICLASGTTWFKYLSGASTTRAAFALIFDTALHILLPLTKLQGEALLFFLTTSYFVTSFLSYSYLCAHSERKYKRLALLALV